MMSAHRPRVETQFFASMEASMGRVLEKFSEHTKIDVDTIETELFAAIRALEVDPKEMTVDDLRQCLLIYLDEVFYGISPEKTQ
jgi:hypothetical protein